MKLFGKRLLFFLVPLLVFLAANILYNYWLDPYGVIKEDMLSQKTEPNQHYIKTKFIIEHPEKFNAFLFGSSRVGKIDIRKIKDGNNWYNFSYSEAVPLEILSDLELLLENRVGIKKILVGLDEISYLISAESHINQTLRKSYVNKFNPLYEYYLLPPSPEMFKTIRDMDKSEFYSPGMYADIYTTGCFLENKKDDFIKKDSIHHIKDPVFDLPISQVNFHNRTGLAIAEIDSIISLCAVHNIECIFFINPMHIKNYMRLDHTEYSDFLKKLSRITDFYDFSGINSITANNYFYYETSHYRPVVGEKMVNFIFGYDSSFGQLVNKENINSILEQKEADIKNFRSKNTP